MSKVTADEMIAVESDIKFATEFVGYLEDAKDKLVKELGEELSENG